MPCQLLMRLHTSIFFFLQKSLKRTSNYEMLHTYLQVQYSTFQPSSQSTCNPAPYHCPPPPPPLSTLYSNIIAKNKYTLLPSFLELLPIHPTIPSVLLSTLDLHYLTTTIAIVPLLPDISSLSTLLYTTKVLETQHYPRPSIHTGLFL